MWRPLENARGSARSSPVQDRLHTANFLLCTLLVFCSAAIGLSSVGLHAGVQIREKGLRSELVVEVTMDDLAVDVVEMTGLLMLLLLLLEDHWLLWLRLRLVVMMVLLLLGS